MTSSSSSSSAAPRRSTQPPLLAFATLSSSSSSAHVHGGAAPPPRAAFAPSAPSSSSSSSACPPSVLLEHRLIAAWHRLHALPVAEIGPHLTLLFGARRYEEALIDCRALFFERPPLLPTSAERASQEAEAAFTASQKALMLDNESRVHAGHAVPSEADTAERRRRLLLATLAALQQSDSAPEAAVVEFTTLLKTQLSTLTTKVVTSVVVKLVQSVQHDKVSKCTAHHR